MTVLEAYRIAGLSGLKFGRPIHRQHSTAQSKQVPQVKDWGIAPGVYTAKEFVEQASTLLDSLVIQLGPDTPNPLPLSSRNTLIEGLKASLAVRSRESTLPIEDGKGDPTRREMSIQARKIGKFLIDSVKEVQAERIDPKLCVNNPSQGHIWTPEAASLLMGSHSNDNLSSLYNEWLHQLVLLRDALLPFENFEEVQLTLRDGHLKGTRPLEGIREHFLFHLLSGEVKRTTILDVAKTFTAPSLPSGGYAVQYSEGTIIPSALLTGSQSVLLRYIPALLVEDLEPKELLFDYEHDDYYSIPRTDISRIGVGRSTPTLIDCSFDSVALAKRPASVRALKLKGVFEGGMHNGDNGSLTFCVDIGQITRGLRYAYRTRVGYSSPESTQTVDHDASAILSRSGLGTAETGVHTIKATSPLVRLALLGSIYPENIVLLGKDRPITEALCVGKGYGPRFVIVGGEVE